MLVVGAAGPPAGTVMAVPSLVGRAAGAAATSIGSQRTPMRRSSGRRLDFPLWTGSDRSAVIPAIGSFVNDGVLNVSPRSTSDGTCGSTIAVVTGVPFARTVGAFTVPLVTSDR